MPKTEQLQIRVSAEQKRKIKTQAALAGEDVSKWVLRKLLPPLADEFQRLIDNLAQNQSSCTIALADLHDFLESLTARTLAAAIQGANPQALPAFEANYLAAMVDYACARKQVIPPAWVGQICPLLSPWFASELVGLRLYLLVSSPAPFRQRNLFVDSTLGARI